MNQRETIFCPDFLDKINPPKHVIKRPVSRISEKTGIDFKHGEELPPPKQNMQAPVYRNLEQSTGAEIAQSPNKKAKGEFYRDSTVQSTKTVPHGIVSSKKHLFVEDSIKGNEIQKVSLEGLKYKDPVKQERVQKYMNSSSLKECLNLDHEKFYKGLLPQK